MCRVSHPLSALAADEIDQVEAEARLAQSGQSGMHLSAMMGLVVEETGEGRRVLL